MAFVDPLKNPQRFVHQADALIRQSMVNPAAADPFAVIDAQLEASFDSVLASMTGAPDSNPPASQPQSGAQGESARHSAAPQPHAQISQAYQPAQFPPFGAVSMPPPGALGALSFAPGLNPLNSMTAMAGVNPYYAGTQPIAAVPKAEATLASGSPALDPIINEMSTKYQVPEWLIRNVIRAESGGNPLATSPVGAMGLMQLMPGTALDLGVTDPYDARENIEGGAKYLRRMLDMFGGDMTKAVAAYNAGPGNVQRFDGVPPFTETQNYVKRVLG